MARFIKLPRNRQYEYTPRYYDEKKERLQNRQLELEKELEEEKKIKSDSQYAENIKGQMHGVFKYRKRQEQRSNFRLVLILTLLFALFYYFFLR